MVNIQIILFCLQSTSVGTSGPSATITSDPSIEPPLKRQRRAVTLKKAVVPAETESDDDDDQDATEITIAKVRLHRQSLWGGYTLRF